MNRRILNLGAGTQSSVIYLMMVRGELEPAEVAIFSDTGWEPAAVYDHLNWLESEGGSRVPIVRLQRGNLRDDAVAFRRQRYHEDPTTGRKGYASIPLFVLNPDGSQGVIRRQCTAEYKIEPIQRYIRRTLLGLAPGQRIPKGVTITQVFGISYDEIQRMRIPTEPWATFEYPLIERRMKRHHVIDWARERYPHRTFPRSACIGCPYRSNEEWKDMRDNRPDEWADAVAFDRDIREADAAGQVARGMLVGSPFVHRQMVPLDQADLRDADEKSGQISLFENECEGMCGV